MKSFVYRLLKRLKKESQWLNFKKGNDDTHRGFIGITQSKRIMCPLLSLRSKWKISIIDGLINKSDQI